MRIGLLTDGGYPYATGESRLWCDRLVRGLAPHEFDVYALSRSARQEAAGWIRLPDRVTRVRTAPLWTPAGHGPYGRGPRGLGRRDRRRFADAFAQLATAVCAARSDDATAADAFAAGLYGLADLAGEHGKGHGQGRGHGHGHGPGRGHGHAYGYGGLGAALRSESAVRLLESACRAPGARRSAQAATVPDFLVFADRLERALRPLSLDWYGDDGLAAVDLCHAASGGPAALPGLLAKRFFGVPLLVTEYGVRLRAHYLATGAPDGAEGTAGDAGEAYAGLRTPVRALLAAFHRLLAAEVYRQAGAITPGNAHARRWQERCGADRAKLRTVHPGMEARRFEGVGEAASGDGRRDTDPDGARDSDGAAVLGGDPTTVVWVGRIEPGKDLISLLHAFAVIHGAEPAARLRIVGAPVEEPGAAAYLTHCRGLAAQLFPDEAADAHTVGENPVSFEEIGGPEAPDLPGVYAAAGVIVLSSVVEGFPISLVEAMFCGRATVSTDVGAVVEVIGGTGLVVPPRNPRALADACLTLLRDPERRARLGAAARARALELFTVEQNLAAFRSLYLELISHAPVRRPAEAVGADGEPLLFATPPEMYVPGRWTAGSQARASEPTPASEPAQAPAQAQAPAPESDRLTEASA
ncbi:glycosyltransferase [Streptomyces sp. NPDC093109]|uniref:DUF3492 domain-containing protein n=1 Tax=Streptomyces sp. NPDC093109 TaxID=3154977 RepID=UPI00344F64CE